MRPLYCEDCELCRCQTVLALYAYGWSCMAVLMKILCSPTQLRLAHRLMESAMQIPHTMVAPHIL
ncbi:hypothetical protein OESDEN_14057 [Oesophagostomum dentatum]|uniref:Uncharacterized protein n=1 Tax=Oesophagostomum dentatum TaxID=61180 RepID=A0A0B1SQQ0_OESDE|nr:hypothetical protein OESDEN_14057 [Oesophagostomum dentatum]